MKYDIDLGSWERGRVITVQAQSVDHALKQASHHLEGDDIIVQVREQKSRRCVYDFFNGVLR